MSHARKMFWGRSFLVAMLVPWVGAIVWLFWSNKWSVLVDLHLDPLTWLSITGIILLMTSPSVLAYALGFWVAFRVRFKLLKLTALVVGAALGWSIAIIAPKLMGLPFSTEWRGGDVLRPLIDPIHLWPWLVAAVACMILIGWPALRSTADAKRTS